MWEYAIPVLVSGLVGLILLVLSRLALWGYSVVAYRVTLTPELTTLDNPVEWRWLAAFLEDHRGDALRHFRRGANSKISLATVPIPVNFAFENKNIKVVIYEVQQPSGGNNTSVRSFYKAILRSRQMDGPAWERLFST